MELIKGIIIFVLLIVVVYNYANNIGLKELLKDKNNIILEDNNIISMQEKLIYKLEIDIDNKKKTIKFLSDQNIVLNNQVNNIEKYYADNSDAIKEYHLKKGEEKFIKVLQTSK